MLSKATIKDIQSLQHKKFRNERMAFAAEGPKVVDEFLTTGYFECEQVFATAKWKGWQDEKLLSTIGEKIQLIEDFELEKIASYATPNQIVALFKIPPTPSIKAEKNSITILLDSIQDPGNLGTIIRTADWFGIKNIICSENTVDQYNSKVVQSTMASLGRVNLGYTNLEKWTNENHQIPLLAAVLNGKSIASRAPIMEGVLMIGNEANGLSQALIEKADEHVTIPRFGGAESLNAAVATSIFLYELTKR
jgi:TrmH family RNA methyltransferase